MRVWGGKRGAKDRIGVFGVFTTAHARARARPARRRAQQGSPGYGLFRTAPPTC